MCLDVFALFWDGNQGYEKRIEKRTVSTGGDIKVASWDSVMGSMTSLEMWLKAGVSGSRGIPRYDKLWKCSSHPLIILYFYLKDYEVLEISRDWIANFSGRTHLASGGQTKGTYREALANPHWLVGLGKTIGAKSCPQTESKNMPKHLQLVDVDGSDYFIMNFLVGTRVGICQFH